ncbi:MAG: hypothetical protein RL120_01215, partial [Gammaproteobacteria bacterium]
MRYIVVFLVLANLAYFGWDYFLAEPVQPVALAPGNRALLNNGLTLLREFDAQSAQLRADGPSCFHVGAFPSVDDANSFAAAMAQRGLQARLYLTGEALDPLYRLYIPPLSTQNVATITLDGLAAVLAQAGLEIETYIVTRGVLSNAIALGVYDDAELANALQQQVIGLGYPVELEAIPRSTGVIQVELQRPETDPAGTAEWPEITAFGAYLTGRENV